MQRDSARTDHASCAGTAPSRGQCISAHGVGQWQSCCGSNRRAARHRRRCKRWDRSCSARASTSPWLVLAGGSLAVGAQHACTIAAAGSEGRAARVANAGCLLAALESGAEPEASRCVPHCGSHVALSTSPRNGCLSAARAPPQLSHLPCPAVRTHYAQLAHNTHAENILVKNLFPLHPTLQIPISQYQIVLRAACCTVWKEFLPALAAACAASLIGLAQHAVASTL